MRDFILGMSGAEWALFGGALAAIGGGIGSAIGITHAANTATGVVSEDSEKFGKLLPLVAMPGTQGIYGFITALLVLIFFGFFGEVPELSATEGMRIFFACLPVAFVCMVSAIYQGLTGVGAIGLVAKRDEDAGKAIIYPAMVETYAVLSLIVTVLMLFVLSR